MAIAALPTAVLVVSTIVDDHGWSAATFGRIVVFVAIYAAVIAGTRPTVEPVDGGWVATQRTIALMVLVVVSLIGVALYFGGVE